MKIDFTSFQELSLESSSAPQVSGSEAKEFEALLGSLQHEVGAGDSSEEGDSGDDLPQIDPSLVATVSPPEEAGLEIVLEGEAEFRERPPSDAELEVEQTSGARSFTMMISGAERSFLFGPATPSRQRFAVPHPKTTGHVEAYASAEEMRQQKDMDQVETFTPQKETLQQEGVDQLNMLAPQKETLRQGDVDKLKMLGAQKTIATAPEAEAGGRKLYHLRGEDLEKSESAAELQDVLPASEGGKGLSEGVSEPSMSALHSLSDTTPRYSGRADPLTGKAPTGSTHVLENDGTQARIRAVHEALDRITLDQEAVVRRVGKETVRVVLGRGDDRKDFFVHVRGAEVTLRIAEDPHNELRPQLRDLKRLLADSGLDLSYQRDQENKRRPQEEEQFDDF